MEICADQTVSGSGGVHADRNVARVHLPRMEQETDYFLLEDQLLSELGRRPPTTWIIDLSEHRDGVTLVVAGVLAGLCEEARRLGHTVKCMGLQKPCAKCAAGCGATSIPAARTIKESWIGMAVEPSFLC